MSLIGSPSPSAFGSSSSSLIGAAAGAIATPAWSGSSGGWKGIAGGNGAMATQQARKLVPKSLVDSFGGLCDDPAYSDVAFLLPSRSNRSKRIPEEARAGIETSRDASPFSEHAAQTDETTSPTTVVGSFGLDNVMAQPPGFLPTTSVPDDSTGREGMSSRQQPKTHSTRYRKVYAIKKMLRRSDYFVGMFDSGFSEGSAGRAGETDDEEELRVSCWCAECGLLLCPQLES
jgi:hypothetical protein